MGSMVYLRCGHLEVECAKNYGGDHRALFQSGDIATHPFETDLGDILPYTSLSRPLGSIVPRLPLLGITAESVAEECVREMHEYWDPHASEPEPPAPEEVIEMLSRIKAEELSYDESRPEGWWRIAPSAPLDESMRTRVAAALDHAQAWGLLALIALTDGGLDLKVTWDVGEALLGGWIDDEWLQELLPTNRRFLIVGEGTSDTAIIRAALELLYPEVADFFYFVDMDKGYPFSGTGNVYRFVQGLASMQVLNRVLVILDNDVAGCTTHGQIMGLGLPANIAAMVLPHMSAFESFRTAGPSGPRTEDINGRAVSTECFLDLSYGSKQPPVVRWTNYDGKAQKYQGSLEAKDGYNRHFVKRVAKGNHASSYDFSKLKVLVDAVLQRCADLAHVMAQ